MTDETLKQNLLHDTWLVVDGAGAGAERVRDEWGGGGTGWRRGLDAKPRGGPFGPWISSEGSSSRRAWLRPFCCLARCRRALTVPRVAPNYKTNAVHSIIIQLADVPTYLPRIYPPVRPSVRPHPSPPSPSAFLDSSRSQIAFARSYC